MKTIEMTLLFLCGKSQHEVKNIAGPTVFICDECVELCMDIIREEHKGTVNKHHEGVPTPSDINQVLTIMSSDRLKLNVFSCCCS